MDSYQAYKVKRVACAAFVVAATLLLDQVTKSVVRQTIALTHERVVAVPGLLNLLYVENRGAAFGMFEGAHVFFIACAFVISIAGLAYLLIGKTKSWPETLSIALIISGACGNVIDRALYGFVTDFFSLAFINFPVFNVADICITVGCVLLVLSVVFSHPADTVDVSES